LIASVAAGDLIYGNVTPKWARLAKDTDGKFLKIVGGLPGWAAHGLSYGDVGAEVSGATAIHAALTTGVHGVAGGTVAKVGDIATDTNLSAAMQALKTAPPTHGASVHDATTLDTTVKLLAESIRPTYNRLAGVLGVATTFDTAPTSLANMTDNDWTTWTGEGVKTLTGAGNVGYLTFDLGAVYPVLILAYGNWHRDSGDGTVQLVVQSSEDNSNWVNAGGTGGSGSTNINQGVATGFAYARYFRLYFLTSTAPTGSSVFHVKVAEVMALQLL
jgi:hypothetical protein